MKKLESSTVSKLKTTVTTVKTTSHIMYSKKQLLSSTSVNSFTSNAEEFNQNMNLSKTTTMIKNKIILETKSVITDSKQKESSKWNKSLVILSVCVPILVFLGVFPLIHYYLVTKPKLKARKESVSSSVLSTGLETTIDSVLDEKSK